MSDAEDYVEEMKRSRDGSSVLKMDLIDLRSELPDSLIFVFEGDDDRGVYFSWCKRINPDLAYEPFVCKGKDRVLQLKRSLDQDAAGLSRGVFFFVDRDFNDLGGEQVDDSIFMTDGYSIENYLVSSKVLDELLKMEFHCHGKPRVRSQVLASFEGVYAQFLNTTKLINRELYAARALGIKLRSQLPDKINRIAIVRLSEVSPTGKAAAEIVKPLRLITEAEFGTLEDEFSKLDPALRYRGKFACMFFLKWLELLAADRVSSASVYFGDLEKNVRVRASGITLSNLALKSALPAGLKSFLNRAVA